MFPSRVKACKTAQGTAQCGGWQWPRMCTAIGTQSRAHQFHFLWTTIPKHAKQKYTRISVATCTLCWELNNIRFYFRYIYKCLCCVHARVYRRKQKPNGSRLEVQIRYMHDEPPQKFAQNSNQPPNKIKGRWIYGRLIIIYRALFPLPLSHSLALFRLFALTPPQSLFHKMINDWC